MTTGVVVMAYGTPASPEEIEAYYTHIRRGRPPTPEQLADLQGRYAVIGGVSPLRRITESQVDAIRAALGDGYIVTVGYKHAAPFIEDAIPTGVDRIVGVVLTPHYSRRSVGEYESRLRAAAGTAPVTMVESWHDLPEWRSFQADAVRATLRHDATVVFTAHSLPERALVGDPYPDQLQESAAAIADAAGAVQWRVAWQSAGRTPDVWQGPDIGEVIDDLDDGVVVCPQGFTADGLELLYDLDLVAAERAAARGVSFIRTRSVNDDDTVMAALARRIAHVAEAVG